MDFDRFALSFFEVDCDGSACGSGDCGPHVHPPQGGFPAMSRVTVRKGQRTGYAEDRLRRGCAHTQRGELNMRPSEVATAKTFTETHARQPRRMLGRQLLPSQCSCGELWPCRIGEAEERQRLATLRQQVQQARKDFCDLGYHEGVPMVTPPAMTPGCEPHTPHPRDYVAHSDWADLMMKTHTQRQCKGCGRWSIWEPKEP